MRAPLLKKRYRKVPGCDPLQARRVEKNCHGGAVEETDIWKNMVEFSNGHFPPLSLYVLRKSHRQKRLRPAQDQERGKSENHLLNASKFRSFDGALMSFLVNNLTGTRQDVSLDDNELLTTIATDLELC
jgi:hypothetical protein